ncbi:MAG: hypothetical protein HKN29_13215 [Rhodothermales bacterium]|nr:hypothetical protein [Rhodothermales bacterium]
MLALTTQKKSTYPEPSLEEMIGLAADFGMVSKLRRDGTRLHMEVLNEPMDMTLAQAAVMLKGLLLGYFYNQKRDDLSLAQWEW